ncbi:MAG: galactokinase [Actinobacteria bacterium]|nr:galactokinase [Actinomycetota bacterium]
MIISRTPFRVTLGGGGTDLPSFYEKHGGFIFAMGLDKYMYVFLNRPFVDRKVRLHYTKSETVDRVDGLKHELAREALKLHGIECAIEISSLADLPASTGLGSSSCYLVGLLTALHNYRHTYLSLQELAEEACHIELNILRKGIGKQDQYMAAFGGLTVLEIAKDGKVGVRQLGLGAGAIAELVANSHLYFLGKTRDAQEVLSDQDKAMKKEDATDRKQVEESLCNIKELGYRILEAIENENFDDYGLMMDEHWQNKKRLSNKISLTEVDELYDYVKKEFGVLGGKIVGAGGGGFLMLYCPKEHKKLANYMATRGYQRLHYNLEFEGSKVVANLHTSQNIGIDHSYVLAD